MTRTIKPFSSKKTHKSKISLTTDSTPFKLININFKSIKLLKINHKRNNNPKKINMTPFPVIRTTTTKIYNSLKNVSEQNSSPKELSKINDLLY